MPFSRNISEGLTGGRQPRDAAAAAALGVLAGATCGGNFSWTAWLLAAILFNVHTRLFLAAWLSSLLLAWLARERLEELGRFLMDGTLLGRSIGQLGDGVLPALLGWDQYALAGGLAAGALAAPALAYAAYRLTVRLGGKRSLRRAMQPRLLRRGGAPAALAAALALAFVPWWFSASLLEREFLREMSAYNGAEVSSGGLQLSLVSGDFSLRDLQIANPLRLDRDRLLIGEARGKLSPGLLLRGHLDIEKLVLEHVRTDVARRKAAHRCGPPAAAIADAMHAKADASLPFRGAEGDLALTPPLRNWRTVCRQLDALRQLVAAVERLSRAEDVAATALSGRHATGHRSELGAPRPWIAVRQLRVADLAGAVGLGRKSLLELTDLSSNPALATRPAQIKVVLPKFGAELQLGFPKRPTDGRPALRCSACDVELASLIDLARADPLVLLASGRARISAEGWFDRQAFDLRLLIEIQSLRAEVAGHRTVAGIEPRLFNDGLQRLDALKAEISLAGPWSSPKLIVDRSRFVEQFNRQLRAAGESNLAEDIERQIAQTEQERDESAVLQATAIEPQREAGPGLCEFSEELLPDSGYSVVPEEHAENEAAPESIEEAGPPAVPYPTTSQAYEEPSAEQPPAAPRDEAAVVQRRSLPGPRNMAVGRDPNVSLAGLFDDAGGRSQPARSQRESLLSRWSQGLRQKFGQTAAKPATPPEPTANGQMDPADERMIPAAASEAWYNRRWR